MNLFEKMKMARKICEALGRDRLMHDSEVRLTVSPSPPGQFPASQVVWHAWSPHAEAQSIDPEEAVSCMLSKLWTAINAKIVEIRESVSSQQTKLRELEKLYTL